MTDGKKDFGQVMARQNIARLADIVNSPEGEYDSMAVEAAKKELMLRNVSEQDIKWTEVEIAERIKEFEARKNVPLTLRHKIICILLPGNISLNLADNLGADGYEAKADACFRLTYCGFAFYILLVILIAVF